MTNGVSNDLKGDYTKTPEEIKKGLECCSNKNTRCRKGCPYVDDGSLDALIPDALAYIQQLEAQVPKWISVEDRLPDDGEEVIVRVEDMIGAATFYGIDYEGEQQWTYTGFGADPEYWMPKSILLEASKENFGNGAA